MSTISVAAYKWWTVSITTERRRASPVTTKRKMVVSTAAAERQRSIFITTVGIRGPFFRDFKKIRARSTYKWVSSAPRTRVNNNIWYRVSTRNDSVKSRSFLTGCRYICLWAAGIEILLQVYVQDGREKRSGPNGQGYASSLWYDSFIR